MEQRAVYAQDLVCVRQFANPQTEMTSPALSIWQVDTPGFCFTDEVIWATKGKKLVLCHSVGMWLCQDLNLMV